MQKGSGELEEEPQHTELGAAAFQPILVRTLRIYMS